MGSSESRGAAGESGELGRGDSAEVSRTQTRCQLRKLELAFPLTLAASCPPPRRDHPLRAQGHPCEIKVLLLIHLRTQLLFGVETHSRR